MISIRCLNSQIIVAFWEDPRLSSTIITSMIREAHSLVQIILITLSCHLKCTHKWQTFLVSILRNTCQAAVEVLNDLSGLEHLTPGAHLPR